MGRHADQEKTQPWTRDTLVNVYSTTKGMTAICAHQLVEQGRLDLDGVHVLDPDGIARCHAEQSVGPDLVLGLSTRFGLGFMLSQPRPGASFGPNPRAFGHPGAGGSVGFADPDARVGFGYTMNRMGRTSCSTRARPR